MIDRRIHQTTLNFHQVFNLQKILNIVWGISISRICSIIFKKLSTFILELSDWTMQSRTTKNPLTLKELKYPTLRWAYPAVLSLLHLSLSPAEVFLTLSLVGVLMLGLCVVARLVIGGVISFFLKLSLSRKLQYNTRRGQWNFQLFFLKNFPQKSDNWLKSY